MFKLRKSASSVSRLRSAKESLVQNVSAKFERLEKRVEGTMAENWLKYWKNVCKDYRDVAVDVVKESREKPAKATLIATGAFLTGYFAKYNPDKAHFRDAFIKAANEASLCHQDLIRDDVKEHLAFVEQSFNKDMLRYTSLGVMSFVWVDNFSQDVKKFDAQCDYLRVGYLDRLNRIVDIGFLGTWWCLTRKMRDFDVNY